MRELTCALAAAALVGCGAGSPSDGTNGDPAGAPSAGVVSFVRVTSDRVDDVSSLDAWRSAFASDGMSDADRAQSAWRSVVAFRHQDEPAREFLEWSGHVHDPIKLFNVYGYSQCDCAAASLLALGRAVGLDGRGRSLTAHSVAELPVGGGFRMFDAAYVDQFPRADGALAGVDDIVASVTDWMGKHPELDGDRAALEDKMMDGSWRDGPPLLASCPFYDAHGLFPARVQGWADTMLDYRVPSPETEFGYSLGYRVNLQLRKGERITRNWSNDGKCVNDDLGIACLAARDVPGRGDMAYSPSFGDLAPGRVGNGTVEYALPLDGDWRAGALSADGLDAAGGRAVVADPSRPGVLVVRMASSYVYLDGAIAFTVEIGGGGSVALDLSRNHGLDWTPLGTFVASGDYNVDLPSVRRLYDYRLRVTLVGDGTALAALKMTNTIQHSQRALPALAAGDNQIKFSAGPDEGTITIQGATDGTQTKNLSWRDLHAQADAIADAPLRPTGASGAVTFPVETPGDLVRLRFGAFYCARAAADGWDYQVSFDGGATFSTVARAAGPTVGAERYVSVDAPAGVRSALVRFAGTQVDTANLFDFRIDADYREPSGAFAPIRVTYAWDENGAPKSDVHVARTPADAWTIHCDAPPRMRSIVLERQ